ncbi:GYD domain-containing protein [Aromatoleum diolicum]|uniref:GYD domain-containing protein n=1 Tax=Aromatoleum diolicum TaxID=75796 RepID=A0ABX1QJ63_9RHOO|nr:GYD domain-containing protein [Aromatoleum diolicum]NMG77290.1 GYD domain-containing protein [Aromatoleum diolicum]
MAKYLFEARYTAEGAKGLVREGGSGRRAAVAAMAEGLGGKLESFYFAFGDIDAYVIVDVPDSITAAAVALAVNQSGGASVKTVVLMTPEDVDKASKKAVDYRPPGR